MRSPEKLNSETESRRREPGLGRGGERVPFWAMERFWTQTEVMVAQNWGHKPENGYCGTFYILLILPQ